MCLGFGYSDVEERQTKAQMLPNWFQIIQEIPKYEKLRLVEDLIGVRVGANAPPLSDGNESICAHERKRTIQIEEIWENGIVFLFCFCSLSLKPRTLMCASGLATLMPSGHPRSTSKFR